MTEAVWESVAHRFRKSFSCNRVQYIVNISEYGRFALPWRRLYTYQSTRDAVRCHSNRPGRCTRSSQCGCRSRKLPPHRSSYGVRNTDRRICWRSAECSFPREDLRMQNSRVAQFARPLNAASVPVTTESCKNVATTLSRTTFSGYVAHATVFSWTLTIACCLVVGSDLVSGWLMVNGYSHVFILLIVVHVTLPWIYRSKTVKSVIIPNFVKL